MREGEKYPAEMRDCPESNFAAIFVAAFLYLRRKGRKILPSLTNEP
jgi:hypothetical protein